MTNRTLTLRALDIPTVHKFGIGFDSMLDELMRVSSQTNSNYPPHNVIKSGENSVIIEVAVAGFDEGEINITVESNTLNIEGTREVDEIPLNYEYLHRGLGRRNFTQSFRLAEHVEVKDASVKNGILTVYLEREIPEDQLPKQIAIKYNK